MPELPEVESLRQILARSAVGRTIIGARIGEARLRRRIVADFASAVAGRQIVKLSRRAKYLILELDGDQVMLVHLGMSGSLTHRGIDFSDSDFNPKHDHVEFSLDDSSRLVYNDPRRFGMMRLIARTALDDSPELKDLGPEPLSREFNADYLASKAHGRQVAIKNLIMDQKIVAGMGGIPTGRFSTPEEVQSALQRTGCCSQPCSLPSVWLLAGSFDIAALRRSQPSIGLRWLRRWCVRWRAACLRLVASPAGRWTCQSPGRMSDPQGLCKSKRCRRRQRRSTKQQPTLNRHGPCMDRLLTQGLPFKKTRMSADGALRP
jgi:hypothetical protein